MNISISLDDLYAIGTYGRLVGSSVITNYPLVIEAVKTIDPDETCYLIREIGGQLEMFSVEEWILYKQRSDLWDKQQQEKKSADANLGEALSGSIMDKVQALDPELAALLKQQQGS